MIHKPSAAEVDISIIITTHAEGILIHRTLASVKRAIKQLDGVYTSEILLHADNPTPQTLEYINCHEADILKNVTIFKNSFKDLGASRNFSISNARGRFIATIDADDLMSGNWLRSALDALYASTEETVAHSEVTVEFEGADSLVIKHGEIDRSTDTLLSVFSNRWNSVIVAPRQLLLEEPYSANSPGFGYEDWHLNCRLIDRGVHNILIPETAIFVRRKKSNSEWLRQIQSMAVLRANPLLSFDSIRTISDPFAPRDEHIVISSKNLKQSTKELIKKYPVTHKVAKHLKKAISQRREAQVRKPVSGWLKKEWKELHSIERQIFPSYKLLNDLAIYDTITEDHKLAGHLYKKLVDQLRFDSYDYVLFVPWVIKGGADRYAINYANTIAKQNPDKRVLVIATLPVESTWKHLLDDVVDFLDFGNITQTANTDIKHRLMGHLIENGNIKNIHIINSEFGYDFIRLHEDYIRSTDRKIVLTAFSQSLNEEGRTFGYSHTHVPLVYDLATLITSDNQTVLDMWKNDYGFNESKLRIHRQSIKIQSTTSFVKKNTRKGELKVLWAARVAPEKQPELLSKIGKLLPPSITIDAYGTIEEGYGKYLENLPSNVTYKGGFDGLPSIPVDEYDAFLYTSLFDGMPNSILDAAELHLPMVASAIGGIPEFIRDEFSGMLVSEVRDPHKYAEILQRLANEPSTRKNIAENAFSILKKDYSPRVYEENVAEMLRDLGY